MIAERIFREKGKSIGERRESRGIDNTVVTFSIVGYSNNLRIGNKKNKTTRENGNGKSSDSPWVSFEQAMCHVESR